jgi:serine/threonine protein kinase
MSSAAKSNELATILSGDTGPAPASSPKSFHEIGHYRILHLLGRGGMGAVYTAYDPRLGRKVAIKVIRIGRAPNDSAEANAARLRFLQEARSLAMLRHPNVVPIFDVGTLDSGEVFMAMELVVGTSLRQLIAQSAMPWRRALKIARETAHGLAYAHEKGLVHRDIKPDNLLIRSDGSVAILDFGLVGRVTVNASGEGDDARRTESDIDVRLASTSTLHSLEPGLTLDGAIMGTPRYMAPEQALGRRASTAADVFALCLVLYEMIHQRVPYRANDFAERLAEIEKADFPFLRRVPKWLRAIIRHGLEFDESSRLPSMAALLERIEYDERRQRVARQIGAAVLCISVAGVGVGASLSQRVGPQSCVASPSGMADLSDDAQFEKIATSFRAVASSAREDLVQRTTERIRSWLEKWRQIEIFACRAARGELTDFSTRIVSADDSEWINICLDQRRSQMHGLFSFLQAPLDAAAILAAPSMVSEIDDPSNCRDVATFRAQAPMPADFRDRARTIEARKELANLSFLVQQAKYGEAESGLIGLEHKLGPTEFLGLRAERLRVWAKLRLAQGRVEEAGQFFDRALTAARASAHHYLAAELAIARAHLRGYRLNEVHEREAYVNEAESLVLASGSPPRLDLEETQLRAFFADLQGQFDLAKALRLQARDALRNLPEDLALAGHLAKDLATNSRRLGQMHEADAFLLESIGYFKRLHGENHPMISDLLTHIARNAFVRSDVGAFADHTQEALRICRHSGVGDEICGEYEYLAGAGAYLVGDFLRAIDSYQVWQRIQTQFGHRVFPGYLWAESELVPVYLDRGDNEMALNSARQGVEKIDRESNPSTDALAPTYLYLALAQVRMQRLSEAENSRAKGAAALKQDAFNSALYFPLLHQVGFEMAMLQHRYNQAQSELDARSQAVDAIGNSILDRAPVELARSRLLLAQERPQEALRAAELALSVAQEAKGSAPAYSFDYHLAIAQAAFAAKRFEEARLALVKAEQVFDRMQYLERRSTPLVQLKAELRASVSRANDEGVRQTGHANLK